MVKDSRAQDATTKRLHDAEQSAAHWLYLGNKAAERGERDKAERHYERSQKWHDRMNELLGNC